MTSTYKKTYITTILILLFLPVVVITILFFLTYSGPANIFEYFTYKTKKVDYDTSYENAVGYTEELRDFFASSDYDIEYDEEWSGEWLKTDDKFSIESKYNVGDSDRLSIFIDNRSGVETFSIHYDANVDEYGPGKSGIDMDIVMQVLDRVSGYEFSEKDISGFIEKAIKKRDVSDLKKSNYKIHAHHRAIDFWDTWQITYSIQEDNSVTGEPHPKYDVKLTISGLTKTGTK